MEEVGSKILQSSVWLTVIVVKLFRSSFFSPRLYIIDVLVLYAIIRYSTLRHVISTRYKDWEIKYWNFEADKQQLSQARRRILSSIQLNARYFLRLAFNIIDISMFQMIKRRKEENKNIHENENYETSISIRPSTKVVRVQKFLHSSGEKLQLFRKSFSKLLVEKYTHFSFNNPLLRTDPPSGILKKKKPSPTSVHFPPRKEITYARGRTTDVAT